MRDERRPEPLHYCAWCTSGTEAVCSARFWTTVCHMGIQCSWVDMIPSRTVDQCPLISNLKRDGSLNLISRNMVISIAIRNGLFGLVHFNVYTKSLHRHLRTCGSEPSPPKRRQQDPAWSPWVAWTPVAMILLLRELGNTVSTYWNSRKRDVIRRRPLRPGYRKDKGIESISWT